MDETKKIILEEHKKGNIVVACPDGLKGISLAKFIQQHADGMLYDLNRSEVIVLTFLPDPKWVNDFAVAQVIRALKERIDYLESKNEKNKISDIRRPRDMITEQFDYRGFTFQRMAKDAKWYVCYDNQIVNWGMYQNDLKEWVDGHYLNF